MRLQKDFIYDNNNLLVDFVGRFETITQDFEYICQQIGIGSIPLPHLNVSNAIPYQQYYQSDEAIKMIRQTYAPDVNLLNYEFEQKN